MICLAVKLFQQALADGRDAGGGNGQTEGSVTVFGVKPSVEVDREGTVIVRAVFQALPVIADPPGHTPADHIFFVHIRAEQLNHLRKGDPRLFIGICSGQDLAVGDAVVIGMIAFDIPHGHRLDAPRVVDQDLPVYSEGLVEEGFVPLGPGRDIAHGVQVEGMQAAHFARSHLPEVGERPVIPQEETVGVFI